MSVSNVGYFSKVPIIFKGLPFLNTFMTMFVIISSTERWATAINNILSMDFDLSSGQQSTQVDIHTLYLCMIPS